MDSYICQLNKVISMYLIHIQDYNYIVLDLLVKQYSKHLLIMKNIYYLLVQMDTYIVLLLINLVLLII